MRHLTSLIPGYQLALHTHCVRLLDLLWKETLAQAVPGAPAGAPAGARPVDLVRFRPAFRLVEARYAEHLSLDQLADAVHLHPAYFSTLFKRVTGLSPLRFLVRYRIERARDLLLASDEPLGEIARRTGFYDAAHLIHVFRRVEGVAPGSYRRDRPERVRGRNSKDYPISHKGCTAAAGASGVRWRPQLRRRTDDGTQRAAGGQMGGTGGDAPDGAGRRRRAGGRRPGRLRDGRGPAGRRPAEGAGPAHPDVGLDERRRWGADQTVKHWAHEFPKTNPNVREVEMMAIPVRGHDGRHLQHQGADDDRRRARGRT